jgi:hypothetical protein
MRGRSVAALLKQRGEKGGSRGPACCDMEKEEGGSGGASFRGGAGRGGGAVGARKQRGRSGGDQRSKGITLGGQVREMVCGPTWKKRVGQAQNKI